MKTDNERIQDLAGEYQEFFTSFKRDGSDTVLYKTTDNAPEKVKNMVYEAHGDLLPDDYVYRYIDDALCHIQDISEENLDCPELEPDCYNYDLVAWLHSNLTRGFFVDEAVEEYGIDSSNFNIYSVIGLGQLKEMTEVYFHVLNWLREEVEDSFLDVEEG